MTTMTTPGAPAAPMGVDEVVRLEWLAEKAEFLIRLRNFFQHEESVHFEIYRRFLTL